MKSSRSFQSKSKLVPVKEPASRLSSLSETPTDTSVSVLSAPRKLPPPSVVLSSSPSSLLSQSVEDTGVTRSVLLTLSQPRLPESAVPSAYVLSQPQEVLESSLLAFQRRSSNSPVLRTSTLKLVVPPRPSETSSRLPSTPSTTPTDSLPQTSGRKPASSQFQTKSSPTSSRTSPTRSTAAKLKFDLSWVQRVY